MQSTPSRDSNQVNLICPGAPKKKKIISTRVLISRPRNLLNDFFQNSESSSPSSGDVKKTQTDCNIKNGIKKSSSNTSHLIKRSKASSSSQPFISLGIPNPYDFLVNNNNSDNNNVNSFYNYNDQTPPLQTNTTTTISNENNYFNIEQCTFKQPTILNNNNTKTFAKPSKSVSLTSSFRI